MAKLQDRIKQRRQALGLTLLDLAEKLDVKEATVQRYESGEIKNIKHDTIYKLSQILKCNPSYLMGWTDFVNTPDYLPTQLSLKDKKMLHLFLLLTDSQKDNLIGRAELFVEQNEQEKKQEQTNNNKTRWVYKAARSTDGEKSGYVEMSEEEIQRILNAPETDEDFS